jgi:HK97 family phage major capsid protein
VKLKELLQQIEEKSKLVKGLFDASDAKTGDANGTMTDAERADVIKLNREIEDLEKRVADTKELDDVRAGTAKRLDDLNRPVGGPVHSGAPSAGGHKAAADAIKSLGEQFVDSPEFKGWLAQFPNGRIPDSAKGLHSPAVSLKTLITGLSSGSGGAFVVNEQTGIVDLLGRRPLTLLDIISRRTTGSDTVEYVRQLTRVNAAAPVAEATSASGSSGVKPEGGMTYERVTEPVKTIAEWVPATKRALSDAGQMRGMIDDELRTDVIEAVETQILIGDGVGENFTGIDAVSGTQDQAWVTNFLTTTRKARTLVRTVGRATPSAYVLNPTDWETADLLQDNEARYFFGGPSVIGTPRLWGLPVVENEAQPVGNGWIGDWKRIVLWDREQASISVSDSHADFFIRNLIAILAELRAAMGIIRPSAFVEIDLTA